MNMLREAYEVMKKNFASFFLFEFLFIFLDFFYFLFLKRYMTKYLAQFEALGPAVQNIGSITDKATQQAQVQQLLETISPTTKMAFLLLVVITPLVLWGLWTIFQGMIWRIPNKSRITHTKQYFRNIAVTTAVAFLISILLFTIAIPSTIINLIIIFLVYYLLTISYNITAPSLSSFLKQTLTRSLARFHHYALVMLLLFLSSGILVFLFFTLTISYTTGTFFFLSAPLLILYLCLCIILNILFKIIVALKIHQS